MAKFGNWELRGVPALEAQLAKYGGDIRVKVGRATQDTAFAVRRRAKSNAPKDKHDLENAIEAQGKGLIWRVGIIDASIPSRGGNNSAHQNPWVYGVWYELGFKTRNIEAHPFMGPSVAAEETPHLDRVRAAMSAAAA